jgi:hypothetical protein
MTGDTIVKVTVSVGLGNTPAAATVNVTEQLPVSAGALYVADLAFGAVGVIVPHVADHP